jgi:hypothetical protein
LEYYGFILTPRNGIYNFEGVESLRLCLQHELVLLLSYKINSKYNMQELLLLVEYSLEIWRNEAAVHCEQKRTEVSFKYLEAFIIIWIKEQF